LILNETDGDADEKRTRIYNNGNRTFIATMEDASTTGKVALEIDRTGTAIDSITSGNTTDIPKWTHYGNLEVGFNEDLTPGTDPELQFQIDGNGYKGYIALDGDAMYVGHKSSARDLVLQTNEVDRVTINSSGLSLDGGSNYQIDGSGNISAAGGFLGLGDPAGMTISSGVATATQSHMSVSTQGGAATDDLDTINGVGSGQFLLIIRGDSNVTTLKDGTGNLRLAGDFSFTSATSRILLVGRGTDLDEVSRSVN